jgi:hypothetical protein
LTEPEVPFKCRIFLLSKKECYARKCYSAKRSCYLLAFGKISFGGGKPEIWASEPSRKNEHLTCFDLKSSEEVLDIPLNCIFCFYFSSMFVLMFF